MNLFFIDTFKARFMHTQVKRALRHVLQFINFLNLICQAELFNTLFCILMTRGAYWIFNGCIATIPHIVLIYQISTKLTLTKMLSQSSLCRSIFIVRHTLICIIKKINHVRIASFTLKIAKMFGFFSVLIFVLNL